MQPITQNFPDDWKTRKDSDLIRQHDQRGLSVPVLWTEVITKVCEPYVRLQNGSGVCMPKVFVIGLDWFEKATFCRNLINHMISSRRFFESKKSQHSPRKRKEAIFVLDLDSDSPEFTPPGQISLFECRTLLLGPESTHIATLSGSKDHTRIIRSHHTGVVDALDQQEHFRACVFDLLRAYDKLQSKAPMVIRGPPYSSFGRPQYTKDIEHLLGVLLPTAVVHIRATTPTEPHESTTMSKADASLSWHVLQPHSSSEEHLSRRELQDNCIYSHFHSNHQGLGHSNIWTFDPVALRTTVIWAYHSETPDVLGILYSEYPAPEDEVVTTFLDGCLLWVVLIEDEELVNELFRQVVRTRTEQLPQIRESTNSASPLPDPQKSSLIGMARLNSIDVEEHELDLCLPAPLDVLSKIETRTATGHPRIILIKDGSEVPDWLYTEQINRSKSHESSDDLLYEDNSQQSDGDLTLDIGALPLDYDTGLNESDEGEPYVKIRQADERVPQRWKPQRRFGRAPTA